MSEQLTSNVYVEGKWFGPAYPDNGEPPAGKVDAIAFADLDDFGQPMRDDDGNALRDGQPFTVEAAEEEGSGQHSSRGRASAGAKREA